MAKRRLSQLWTLGLAGLLLTGLGAGSIGVAVYRSRGKPGLPEGLATVAVRRAPFQASVVEDGVLEASEKTIIECELRNLRFRNSGREIQASGSSIVVELLPEGTMVKEGQVLCRLASLEYEEMARLQQLELEEDRAQYRTAQLGLEKLEVQLREYRDGLFGQLKEQLQGQISTAKADVERQKERMLWSERMFEIGYLTPDRMLSERSTMLRVSLDLERATLAYDNLVKFTAPKTISQIQGQIDGARAELTFQEARVKRDEEQLAEYRQQVENCTIRAPHDGFLIYAQGDRDEEPIELGMSVRQDQDLFYLPNLDEMEVHAKLNETVVARIRVGMPALVHVESVPGLELEGVVLSINPLPIVNRGRNQSQDKNYIGRVKLRATSRALMPGMSARVEILTSRKPHALVIPSDALMVEAGRNICYVADGPVLRRREVTIGESSSQMLEITAGLSEGEDVVTDPERIDPDLVVDSPAPISTAADDDTDPLGRPQPAL